MNYQYTNVNNLLCLPVGTQVQVQLHGGQTTRATVVDNRDPSLYGLEHHKTGTVFRAGRKSITRIARKFKRPSAKSLSDMMKEIANGS